MRIGIFIFDFDFLFVLGFYKKIIILNVLFANDVDDNDDNNDDNGVDGNVMSR